MLPEEFPLCLLLLGGHLREELAPPSAHSLPVARNVADAIDAELLRQALDLIHVQGAVLDDQGVGARQVDNVLDQLQGEGQRRKLSLSQHVAQDQAEIGPALHLLVEQRIAIDRVGVRRHVRQHRCQDIGAAEGHAEAQSQARPDFRTNLLPNCFHKQLLQALRGAGALLLALALDLGQAQGDLHEARQRLDHCLPLIQEVGVRLQLGQRTGGRRAGEVRCIRAGKLQKQGLGHARHLVLQELDLFHALREVAEHEVVDAHGLAAVHLCQYQRRHQRRIDRLASCPLLRDQLPLGPARPREAVEERRHVDGDVAVALLEVRGHLRGGRSRRADEVQEPALEERPQVGVDGLGGAVHADAAHLADRGVVGHHLSHVLGHLSILGGGFERHHESHGGDLLLEQLGLLGGLWEALQQEAVRVLALQHGLFQGLQSHLVGDDLPLLDGLLRLRAQTRASGNLGLQQSEGVEVHEVQLLGELRAVRIAARAGASDDEGDVGRHGELGDAVLLQLLRHVDVDDLLLLLLDWWRLHGEGQTVLVDAVLDEGLRASGRLEVVTAVLIGRGGGVGVVLVQPILEKRHSPQALRLHLAEGQQAVRDQLLQRRVQGVVFRAVRM
mmetsp:Transcript_174177/g.558520  ORF Transcript_174177/g.558520 Transcript_174177/m.558520 type:complete len:613 (+) Transcript_174177:1311-3149(+)